MLEEGHCSWVCMQQLNQPRCVPHDIITPSREVDGLPGKLILQLHADYTHTNAPFIMGLGFRSLTLVLGWFRV